ncbi:hypothetical protein CEUSTIGMA_g4802.t1 [Chlamydomonas eustigma]|uniref:Uncharacterized protein n=1 Tax=Chlamydomonas eustigma TaxID=1157962 RepID=A0A250X2S6_9CHLO|nr:hypothetical protein CEUSTIGMA_g4802.t1 [Chlamydomonas eustigma]|eukprot:GAX77356.1 hypothetical protein CEUSTIGMA_g4802.t1 [Chlamydomonas eustigma]
MATASAVQTRLEHAARLSNETASLEDRFKTVCDLNDSLESVNAVEYPAFLAAYLRPLCALLKTVPPQFSERPEHKLRHKVLELLNRCHKNEALAPYVAELFETCIGVLKVDNQECASMAIKPFFEMLKNYKAILETQGSILFEHIFQMYRNFPRMCQDLTEPPLSAEGEPLYAKIGSTAIPASSSFKFLQECPVIVMFLSQMYEGVFSKAGSLLQPLVDTVSFPGPEENSIHKDLLPYYHDMRISQIKALSFLVNNLGKLPLEVTKPYAQATCDSVISLFRVCPDSVTARKDLLNALRGFAQTQYKDMLRGHLETLLTDPDTLLVGTGRACQEAMWHNGYSALAEVVHALRKTLSPALVHAAVMLFASVQVHDAVRVMPIASHTTFVRLMLNLVECIFSLARGSTHNAAVKLRARGLLTRVLECFVSKFKFLRKALPGLLEEARAEKLVQEQYRKNLLLRGNDSSSAAPAEAGPSAALRVVANNAAASATGGPVRLSGQGFSSGLPPKGDKEREVLECKQLLSQVMASMKTIINACTLFGKSCAAPQGGGGMAVVVAATQGLPPGMPLGMTEEEIRIMAKFWSSGLQSLKVALYVSSSTEPAALSSSSAGGVKETYEQFAEVFTCLDTRDFVEVVGSNLERFFKGLVEEGELMHVAAHLLLNPATSRSFLVMLCRFLTAEKLPLLANTKTKEGAITLKLFKLLFTAFVTSNLEVESLLSPILVVLMGRVTRLLASEQDITGYLQFLNVIFKPLSGSGLKLKALIPDLLPFIQPILNIATATLAGPNVQDLRQLLVEVVLHLPAQLPGLLTDSPSNMKLLITLVPQLIRVVLISLKGSDDQAMLGLRTLELWADTLDIEMLEASMQCVMQELMTTIWGFLKPNSTLGMKALTVLGKLGGRNRRFLHHQPPRLEYKDNPEHALRIILTFPPQTSFLVPLDRCIALACGGLLSPTLPSPPVDGDDAYYRLQALRFLHVCLASLLNLRMAEDQQLVSQVRVTVPPLDFQPPGSTVPAAASAAAAVVKVEGQPLQPTEVQQQQQQQAPVTTLAAASYGPGGPASSSQRPHSNVISSDEAVDRMLNMLMSPEREPPAIIALLSKQDMGVKTKTQLIAERQVLVTLLSAVIGATANEKLVDVATPFAHGICRHFALLFAAGTPRPPPAPVMSSRSSSSVPAAAPASAAEGASGLSAPSTVSDSAAAAAAADAGACSLPLGLRELDINLFLDALVELLCDKVPHRARAAVDGLAVFVDTTLMLHSAQRRSLILDQRGLSARVAASDPELTEELTAAESQLPAVIEGLLPRMLHCCCEDTWQARLAGAAAVKLLIHRLPDHFLRRNTQAIMKGLLFVLRTLPDHSVVEGEELQSTLRALLRKCMYNEQPEKSHIKRDRSSTSVTKEVTSSSGHGTISSTDRAPAAGDDLPPGTTSVLAAPTAANSSTATFATGAAAASLTVLSDASWMSTATIMLLNSAVNPNSPTRLRSSAVMLLKVLAVAAYHPEGDPGLTSFLRPYWGELRPPMSDRRVLPVKFVDHMIGQAEALTLYLRHYPSSPAAAQTVAAPQPDDAPAPSSTGPPLLSTFLLSIATEAQALADKEEPSLAARIMSARGGAPPLLSVTRLRVKCMELLCGLFELEEFRTALQSISMNQEAAAESAGSGTTQQQAQREQDTQLSKLREDLVNTLYKNVASSNEDIHTAAKKGLSLLVQHAKVSKASLQLSLRPLLSNLSSHVKLTPSFLQGLGRLLELLHDLFNPSLGEKLLEHLRRWQDPEALIKGLQGPQGLVPVSWRPGEEIEVAATALEMFHLLPASAVAFLETHQNKPGLVVLAMELEDKIPILCGLHSLSAPVPKLLASPFRLPLTRFLVKYPKESASYFLDPVRLATPTYISRLINILKMPEGRPLLLEISNLATDRLLRVLTPSTVAVTPPQTSGYNDQGTTPPPPPSSETLAAVHAVHILSVVSKALPGWLAGQPQLASMLLLRWKGAPERSAQAALQQQLCNRDQLLECKRLAKCILDIVREKRDEVVPLLDLFAVYQVSSIVDYSFLDLFCQKVVTDQYSPEEKKTVLRSFAKYYEQYTQQNRQQLSEAGGFLSSSVVPVSCGTSGAEQRAISKDQVVRLLSVLVMPMLSSALEKGQVGCLDADLIALFIKVFFSSSREDTSLAGSESRPLLLAKNGEEEQAEAALQQSGSEQSLLPPTPSALTTLPQLTSPTALRRSISGIPSRYNSPGPGATPGGVGGPDATGGDAGGGSGLSSQVSSLDSLGVEMLQLGTLLMKHVPDLMRQHPNQLLNFGWQFLKYKKDISVSYALLYMAYVLKAFPVDIFPRMEKTLSQVYVAVLRGGQNDSKRGLLREALDVLLPLFSGGTGSPELIAAGGDAASVPIMVSSRQTSAAGRGGQLALMWPKYTKKVLTEELQSVNTQLHLWHFIVRHPGAFYSHRKDFMSNILGTLGRLSLPQNVTNEQRRLALDLISTLMQWEETAAAEYNLITGMPGQQGKRNRISESAGVPQAHETVDDHGRPNKLPRTVSGSGAPAGVADTAADEPEAKSGPSQATAAAVVPEALPVRLSLSQQENIINVLMRMVLILCSGKDEEAALQHSLASLLMKQAVSLWPMASIRVSFLERVLDEKMKAHAKELNTVPPGIVLPPPPILLGGLQLLSCLLNRGTPQAFLSAASQVVPSVEPCFPQRSQDVVEGMRALIKRVFEYPVVLNGPAYNEAMALRKSLENIITRNLNTAAAEMPALSAPGQPLLFSLCSTLSVLEALEGVPTAITLLDSTVVLVVKCFTKATKEILNQAAVVLQQTGGRGKLPISGSETPEYATLTWILCSCMRLCGPRVLANPDMKKQVLQSMVGLLSSSISKVLDPCLYLQLQQILHRWLADPYPGQLPTGTLSSKEGSALCQRLGSLEKTGIFEGLPALRAKWEHSFLRTLKHMCSSPDVPKELRDEYFMKVERYILFGLRASSAEMRSDFFALYQEHIPKTLFDRFHFIFVGQDWEAMSGSFWLKQALDLVLTILRDEERIILAPNSAQVPPLVAGTQQHVFQPPLPHVLTAPPSITTTEDGSNVKLEEVKCEELGVKQEVKQELPLGGNEATGAVGTASAVAFPGSTGVQGSQHHPISSAVSLPVIRSQGPPARERFASVPSTVIDMLFKHSQFLKSTGEMRVADMMSALREYSAVDPNVAHHFWVLVFPIVWATLEKQQQIALAKPLIVLLSKDTHQRQAMARPNVVQAILEGISLSQPQPKLPPELIKYLGKTYNAWNIAIPLLESHVVIFPDETRCLDALLDLYRGVSDEDQMCGLWRRRCQSELTRVGLSLVQAGQLERAEDILGEAIRTATLGEGQVTRGESALWFEQWTSCSKQLGQWETLGEYARATDNHELGIDCMWRMSDWTALKDTLLTKAQVEEGMQTYMVRSYLALQEGDVNGGEQRTQQAMSAALIKWCQLPEIAVVPQAQLLQVFQQLVELRESVRILVDLANGNTKRDHQFTEMKEILETWRIRRPNVWESLLHWQDVLLWRNQIHNIVINAFSNPEVVGPDLHQLGFKEKAWSVNQLASVATTHGCTDFALSALNNLYGYSSMEMREAFVKIREQAMAYLARPTELQAGLNLLSSIDLNYFQPNHQSEVFRLRGMFLQSLEEPDNAHTAYSTSLCIWKQNPDAWMAWGAHCDRSYEAALAANSQYAAALQNANANNLPPPPPPNQPLQPHCYLEYAVYCYLQGIRQGSAAARASLPRVLHLLSFDNDQGVVGTQLDRLGAGLPLWVWFMWIPQLLTALQRPEAQHVKPILQALATSFPQSMYYSLRSSLLGLRDTSMKAQEQIKVAKNKAEEEGREWTGPDPRLQGEISLFETSKEIMDLLRLKHPLLAQALEAFLQEIGGKFMPKPEERLLSVVTALLQRCYKVHFSGIAEVPAALKSELAGVCRACQSGDSSSSGQQRSSSQTNLATAASVPQQPTGHVALREAFVKDMSPEAATFPKTLGELTDHLKIWRNRLQAELDDSMPPCLRLADECKSLSEIIQRGGYTFSGSLDPLEMPGQYLGGHDVGPENVVLLESFGANISVVRRHSSSYRRLVMYGNDGHARHMLVQTGQSWSQSTTDERVVQLMRLFNKMLEAHFQSRAKFLAWHTPIIVSVWNQARLLEEDPSFCSYGEAYDVYCARYGREADAPITTFKRHCASPEGVITREVSPEIRLAAYQEVCSQLVNESVFSQYMYKTLPTGNHMAVFKKQFCSQMALSSVLCHMLYIGGRSPNKVLYAKDSGRIFQTDIVMGYNDKVILEKLECVPFRLTRNLTTFFNTFGVEGTFAPAVVNAAAALLAKDSNLQHVLSLFFRDDITSWVTRRSGKSAIALGWKNETLKGLVVSNMRKVVERVRAVSPLVPPEDTMPPYTFHVAQGIMDLIEQAGAARNLSLMEPTWHPWF